VFQGDIYKGTCARDKDQYLDSCIQ
jgi:hypothetical protein